MRGSKLYTEGAQVSRLNAGDRLDPSTADGCICPYIDPDRRVRLPDMGTPVVGVEVHDGLFLALLAFASILIKLAITVHDQGEIFWGGPEGVHVRYQSLRKAPDRVLGLRRE